MLLWALNLIRILLHTPDLQIPRLGAEHPLSPGCQTVRLAKLTADVMAGAFQITMAFAVNGPA